MICETVLKMHSVWLPLLTPWWPKTYCLPHPRDLTNRGRALCTHGIQPIGGVLSLAFTGLYVLRLHSSNSLKNVYKTYILLRCAFTHCLYYYRCDAQNKSTLMQNHVLLYASSHHSRGTLMSYTVWSAQRLRCAKSNTFLVFPRAPPSGRTSPLFFAWALVLCWRALPLYPGR